MKFKVEVIKFVLIKKNKTRSRFSIALIYIITILLYNIIYIKTSIRLTTYTIILRIRIFRKYI